MTPSNRRTTSSRRPGARIAGTVWIDRVSLTPCAACGALRWPGRTEGPHAPHWRVVGARHVLVDCVGREVSL